jgi:hypothetical protein
MEMNSYRERRQSRARILVKLQGLVAGVGERGHNDKVIHTSNGFGTLNPGKYMLRLSGLKY